MVDLGISGVGDPEEEARRREQIAMDRGGWEGAAAGVKAKSQAAAASTSGRPAVDETANKMDSLMELLLSHVAKRQEGGESKGEDERGATHGNGCFGQLPDAGARGRATELTSQICLTHQIADSHAEPHADTLSHQAAITFPSRPSLAPPPPPRRRRKGALALPSRDL
jgi:hypothetical protein